MNYEKHKKIFIVFGYIAIFGLLGYFVLFRCFGVLAPFLLAMLFAALICPTTDFFHQKLHMNRKLATLISILLIFGILGTFLTVCVIEIYQYSKGFLMEFLYNPNSFYSAAQGLDMISDHISSFLHMEINLVEMVKNIITPIAQWFVGIAGNAAGSVPHVFVGSIVFILASFFFVADRDAVTSFCLKFLKPKHLHSISYMKKIAKDSILGYLKAQLLLAGITFVELVIGFSLMNMIGVSNIKMVLLIALGVAVLDAFPVFGTGTILIPWAIIKIIAGDFVFAIALLIQYIICLCVRQLIEPKIVGESLGLHPLITLFSMFLGLHVIGIAGMILFPMIALFLIRLYQAGILKELLQKEE